MQRNNFWKAISFFESGLSAAEWAWRITVFILIGTSGTVTAFVAKADPLLKALGPVYWIGTGVIIAFLVSFIFFLIKSAQLKQAEADLNRSLSIPRSTINPLANSFADSIIPVEDLRLPRVQLHENKHFLRCKFVGPAALAIQGGTYVRSNFLESGDVIALPDNVMLSGVVVLKNCTVEDCEFIRTTILVDQVTAKRMAAVPNAQVKGIIT